MLSEKEQKGIVEIEKAIEEIKELHSSILNVNKALLELKARTKLNSYINVRGVNMVVPVNTANLISLVEATSTALSNELTDKTKTLKTYNLILNGEPIDEN